MRSSKYFLRCVVCLWYSTVRDEKLPLDNSGGNLALSSHTASSVSSAVVGNSAPTPPGGRRSFSRLCMSSSMVSQEPFPRWQTRPSCFSTPPVALSGMWGRTRVPVDQGCVRALRFAVVRPIPLPERDFCPLWLPRALRPVVLAAPVFGLLARLAGRPGHGMVWPWLGSR